MNRSAELEMMDLPGQPRDLLADDLHNLRVFNRYLGGHRTVLRGVARVVRKEQLQKFTLLDVGTGSADIPAAIVRWAESKGIGARVVALDREPVTVEEAAAQTRGMSGLSLIRGDGRTPPFGVDSFDIVLASQFLHHFPDEQIVAQLQSWARLARRAIIVNDLVRHPIAYHGVRWLTQTFTHNRMTQTDGPLSVARACTIAEWRELFRRADVGQVSTEWAWPFRVLGIFSIHHRL